MAIEVPDMQRVVGTKSGLFTRRAIRLDGTPECVPYTAEEMFSAAHCGSSIRFTRPN